MKKKLNVPDGDKVFLRRSVEFAGQSFKQSIQNYRIFTQELPSFILDREPVKVTQERLQDCRVAADRVIGLDCVEQGGRAVEIGTAQGNFAKTIIDKTNPAVLHIVDLKFDLFDHEWFGPHIQRGTVSLHEGCSWEKMAVFDDDYFDFIYVDAGHTYEQVSKDLEVSYQKIKSGGIIGCNDYSIWSALDGMPFGVVAAVNEFATKYDVRFERFCLQRMGYYDVFLKVLK